MTQRQTPKTWEEFEQMVGIRRTHPPAPTQADVRRMTKKRLGNSWGKKRAERRPE